jgi:hypothetical protein
MPILRPRVLGGDFKDRDGRVAISATTDRDGALSAITKWIPIEVIAFYQGITTPFGDELAKGLPYVIGAGAVATVLWIGFATESVRNQNRIAWRQVVLSCIAFVFWAIGTTSPDIWKVVVSWWQPAINPAALALGAVLLPIVDGILRFLGIPQD